MPTSATPSAAIHVEHLSKQFRVPVRDSGLRASLRSVVKRTHRTVDAVQDVSFSIAPGEVVGFLGPNGAGKTTTLKMLSGLLHPTTGTVSVLGYQPVRRQRELLTRIALVMGNRQQLVWDVPAGDSFEMLRTYYEVPRAEFTAQVALLTELLDLEGITDKPVRQLSLGERMKCELTAALLYSPDVLFLDEPTLGLDVQAQRRVREFIARYAEQTGATVVLTSHYMADIEALCERVLVIHHGRLQYDGSLRELATRTSDRKLVTLRFAGGTAREEVRAQSSRCGEVLDVDGNECVVELPRSEARERLGILLDLPDLVDFTVEDEPIERVMERVFADDGSASDRGPS